MTSDKQSGGPPDESDRRSEAPTIEVRSVDPKLLEILVCPLTKSSLEYRPATSELISRRARLAFPIIDGIPLMIVGSARELTDDELP